VTPRISRRAMLRGAGAALALPWLEAMAAPRRARPVRMAVLYMPNGVNPHHWTPRETTCGMDLPGVLQPLESLKSEILVLSELTNAACHTGDGHYVKIGGFLTGTTISKTVGSDLRSNGVSMDQLAAQKIGNLTPLPSLELGIEPVTTGVDLVVGYTRLYGSNIAWSTPTTPVAKEISPRLAFDRLFRSNAKERRKDADVNDSVLDHVLEDAGSLKGRVGAADRAKLDEYLDSVRAVEKRIEFDRRRMKEATDADPDARREVERLGGRLKDYHLDPGRLRERGFDHTEHVRLMFDVMALAFWTDSTRVSTFMFGNEVSGRNFSFLPGVSGGHHQISHHENNPGKLEEYKKIGIWHLEQYAYLLGRLASIREGDGTLLDNAMVVFGAGIRDGNAHSPINVPIVLGGRGGGTLRTGRHIASPTRTPLCNLWLSMLRRMGIDLDRFSDSTGEIEGLA